ncbi:uncharacterized protein [Rutidosis leptorrhynchoides]|uniref:uncharacterized protein n=1 Tax=Rutidosis leptorrhynchoides TaxID=125765 RepID=UPI003A9A1BDC
MGKSSAGKKKTVPPTIPRVLRNRKIGLESQINMTAEDLIKRPLADDHEHSHKGLHYSMKNDLHDLDENVSSHTEDESSFEVEMEPRVPENKIGKEDVLVKPIDDEDVVNDGPIATDPLQKPYLHAAAAGIKVNRKANFRFIPQTEVLEDGINVMIPLASVKEAEKRYSNTLYGYFLGKRLAFPIVNSYVLNVWKKYGLEKVMMNSKGFYFFKFDSNAGMLKVLENGPWMIRGIPIILNKWSTEIFLTKEDITRVPVWVKLYDVPLAGLMEEGLSRIASKVGRPMMLDSYTSTMCMESWGRPNYARAMIELSADKDMRESLTIATPCADGSKVVTDMVTIEYEWSPPRCGGCKVFGHKDIQCPKNIPVIDIQKAVQEDGFQRVTKKATKNGASKEPRTVFVMGKQKPIMIYRRVQKTNMQTNNDQTGNSKSTDIGEVEVNNQYDILGGLQDEKIETTRLYTHDESELNKTNQDNVQDVVGKNNSEGASTPGQKESHVPINRLNSICNAVFPRWNWASNNNVCNKGTRIILGWDPSIVQLMVINVTEQDTTAGSSKITIVMREFNECVEELHMEDVNYFGLHYTWNQRPREGTGVMKKIDRVMANEEFFNQYNDAFVIFQPYRISDHAPTVLKFDQRRVHNPKPFKISNYVLDNDQFKNIVSEGWSKEVMGHMMFRVVKRLRGLKSPIRKLMWSKGNIHTRVIELRNQLDEVQIQLDRFPQNLDIRNQERDMLMKFNEACLEEESFLKQKAKVEWLRAGDSNTSYFHRMVKGHTNRNHIHSVLNNNNMLVEGDKVPDIFVNHYKEFLGSSCNCYHIKNPEDLFHAKINQVKARNMIRPVTNLEVKDAIFGIGNDKSPGPDGYSAVFFKHAWGIIGDDVCTAVKYFFNNCQLLKELNHTIVALIPKVAQPSNGQAQMRFKIDIQKAYDTVNWRFLKDILHHFGFHKVMIKWIMACVTTMSFSISINGNLHGYFRGKRGLRQGDPLSPYLFTLVMEVLTLMLTRNISNSATFRFHPKCDQQKIVNLCFADDLFLFSYASTGSVKILADSLEEFKNCSGLVPSIAKSSGFFAHVSDQLKGHLMAIMDFEEGKLPIRYLGVPLVSSRLQYRDCKILVEKVQRRISDWKNKTLSFAGRMQLINSVLALMHIYWASVFLLPDAIMRDIEKLLRGFLWCHGEMKRGKSKVKWSTVCLPKAEGGLGIRSLKMWNVALMTSHIWRLFSNKNSLWVKWIHSYRLKSHSFWDVKIVATESYGWKKLLRIRNVVRPYLVHEIENGSSANVWSDYWCELGQLSAIVPSRSIYRAGFSARLVVSDVPNLNQLEDKLMWKNPQGGLKEFSVNEAAQMCLIPLSSNKWKDIRDELSKERNARFFTKTRRSVEQVFEVIFATVQMKLMSIKFRELDQVSTMQYYQ